MIKSRVMAGQAMGAGVDGRVMVGWTSIGKHFGGRSNNAKCMVRFEGISFGNGV